LTPVFKGQVVVAGAAVRGNGTPDFGHDGGGVGIVPGGAKACGYLGDLLPGRGDAGGRFDGFGGELDPPLGAGEGDALFAKGGGGQDDVGQFGGFG